MIKSAGILCFRKNNDHFEFFVGHPGGPYNKRYNKWGIPKGRSQTNEDSFSTAIREFEEETGTKLPSYCINDYIDLGIKKQNKNKIIHIYAINWDNFDINKCYSNNCEIEYPPKSGIKIIIPEMDRFEWKEYEDIVNVCIPGQKQFFDEIIKLHCYENNK